MGRSRLARLVLALALGAATLGIGAGQADAVRWRSEYQGVISGYRVYCSPGSTTACHQSAYTRWYENANGVCRDAIQREGDIRYYRGHKYFHLQGGWTRTGVIDCRWNP